MTKLRPEYISIERLKKIGKGVKFSSIGELRKYFERQKIAFEAHKDYVDEMYKRFGLAQYPGYCIVEIKPMLVSAGGFFYDGSQDHILVNDVIYDKEEIVDEACHESGHFLHPFARKEYQSGRKANDNLCEIVAHLGSLIYFRIKNGRKRVDEYLKRNNSNDEVLIAKDIFETDMGLLEKIAQSDIEEMVFQYVRRTFCLIINSLFTNK